MRGHFIAADGGYQFQTILDKNIVLEMFFPVCGKSFHPHSSLNSPDCPSSGVKDQSHAPSCVTNRRSLPGPSPQQSTHQPDSPELLMGNCLWITFSNKDKANQRLPTLGVDDLRDLFPTAMTLWFYESSGKIPKYLKWIRLKLKVSIYTFTIQF